ncbi:hypothetical protein H920_12152 [Fukomys damarensis]|uniref:Uncharacterized protein n=1 Tax=Fukomys damarensis TaxID=885580 RepID=A0A091DUJ1_FUKDA|nr:hypothetical protein H920_12152 [Fukomys damarensis]
MVSPQTQFKEEKKEPFGFEGVGATKAADVLQLLHLLHRSKLSSSSRLLSIPPPRRQSKVSLPRGFSILLSVKLQPDMSRSESSRSLVSGAVSSVDSVGHGEQQRKKKEREDSSATLQPGHWKTYLDRSPCLTL